MSEIQRFERQSTDTSVVVEVEASRWDGTSRDQSRIVTWGSPAVSGWFDGSYFLRVDSQGAEMRCDPGDWIVRDFGGFRVFTDEAFRRLYPTSSEPTP